MIYMQRSNWWQYKITCVISSIRNTSLKRTASRLQDVEWSWGLFPEYAALSIVTIFLFGQKVIFFPDFPQISLITVKTSRGRGEGGNQIELIEQSIAYEFHRIRFNSQLRIHLGCAEKESYSKRSHKTTLEIIWTASRYLQLISKFKNVETDGFWLKIRLLKGMEKTYF